jgi:heterodisulfide reductase subunit D
MKNFESDFYSCIRCGFCLDFSWIGSYRMCPSYDVQGFESYSARGKIAIARAIHEGTLELNESVAKRFFSCTDCLACQSNCFKFVDLQRIFRAVKSELVKGGLLPKRFVNISENLTEFKNIYGKPPYKRFDWMPSRSRLGKKAEILYFVGCTSSYLRRRIAFSTYNLLELAKIDFSILHNEWCCGHPYLASGQIDLAREFLEHNIKAIENTGVDRVVFSCPACLKSFRKDAKEILDIKIPFKTFHISELLDEQIQKGTVNLGKQAEKVTYHDPCILSRHLDLYELPRRLLKSIPGIELVEMPRHAKDSYCCGGGNFLKLVFPDIASRIADKRVDEALETEAEKIVTSCPYCQTNLISAAIKKGRKMQVVDLSQLILDAIIK